MREKESLPQGYKASSLGIIPQDWNVLRLGDVCSNNGDYGLNAPAIDYSINMPTYLRITDIDENGKFCTGDMKSVDNPMAKNYYLKDGDIVFARTGATVGKTYLYNKKDGRLVYAGFLIKFSPNDKRILPYYLKVYTETKMYWNWVAVVSQRSGQPGINASEYCSFKMIVPPIEEQKKIAEILSEWDKAIELQTKLVEKLELRKRALMQRLLTGRVRLNGYSVEWENVRLEQIISLTKGEQYNKVLLQKDDKYPVINGGIIPSGYTDKYNSEANTITISEGGNSCGYVNLMTTRFWCGGHCYAVKEKDMVHKLFLYQLLKYHEPIIMRLRVGSGLPNIQMRTLQKYRLRIPPFPEQANIANILITTDREIDLEKQRLSSLRTQKQGLMQQLLTGGKRILL